MRFVWDEAKPLSNLRDHEIDFVDAGQVFAGLTSTFDDTEDVTLVVYRKLNSSKQCSPASRVWRRWKPVTRRSCSICKCDRVLGSEFRIAMSGDAARASACDRGLTVHGDVALSPIGLSSVADAEDLFD
jgi:hypothetical protein